MQTRKPHINKLITERLILIPYTISICENILNNDFSDLDKLDLIKGESWPDADVLEYLPRVIKNLQKVSAPTGYESWMIIKRATSEVIGDLGFKGYNEAENNIDLGYGIIVVERGKGYASEAVTEIIKWAFRNKLLKEITANCLTENLNSMNLLLKFNFTKRRIENDTTYWVLANEHYVQES
jgi:[ribosomal protein S5]-alanine N-acetyltransferase